MKIAEFTARLANSGLMTAEQAAAAQQEFLRLRRAVSPAEIDALSVHDWAKDLVAAKRATMFQISALFLGRPPRLVFGDYLLVDKLATGGMGEVYRAHVRKTGQQVVVKILPAKAALDEEMVRRFRREAQIMLALRHPNIVQALAADWQGDTHWLAMEFVDGVDFTRLIKQRGPLPVAEAVELLVQAADALAYSQGQQIVHRDIKPSNLMLAADGKVKVLDLGLARLVDDENPLTHTGSVLGSVDYMAPEQAFDSKAVDGRVDIYALGGTLHFLLTGDTPFEGRSVMQRVLAHRDRPPPKLSDRRSDIPERLEAYFQKSLAKRPADRWQSPEAVAEELRAIAAELPASARQAPPALAPPRPVASSPTIRLSSQGGKPASASPRSWSGDPLNATPSIDRSTLHGRGSTLDERNRRRSWREDASIFDQYRSVFVVLGVAAFVAAAFGLIYMIKMQY